MRLAAGIALIVRGVTGLPPGPSPDQTALEVLAMAGGILLILGLWTPIAGLVVAIIQLWATLYKPADPWTLILLAALGGGLALLGPGAWSMDARLFGWKRLNFHERKS
jgi:uncharacterized membrane protein YphA (DoxX/SURF4 family)